MKTKILIGIAVVVLGVAGYFYFCDWKEEVVEPTGIATLTDADFGQPSEYVCFGGKTIIAAFTEGGTARLSLSDKRVFTLEHISYDDENGAKFASEGDETVFWTKEESSFLKEKGVETYKGCHLSPVTKFVDPATGEYMGPFNNDPEDAPKYSYACTDRKSMIVTPREGGVAEVALSDKRTLYLEFIDDYESGRKFSNENSFPDSINEATGEEFFRIKDGTLSKKRDDIVLWTKDDSAFLMENGIETYKACRLSPPQFPVK